MPDTKSDVVYINDLNEGQTIHITGTHNYEYVPPAKMAPIAQPKMHEPFEGNKLKHVVEIFTKMRSSGFGPSFNMNQLELIRMVL